MGDVYTNAAGTTRASFRVGGKGLFDASGLSVVRTYALPDADGTLLLSPVDLSGVDATGTLAAARFPALAGDVTTTAGSLTTAIGANKVTDAMLRTSGALSVVGRSANSTGDVADISASSDGQVLRRSGTTLGFGTVATAGIADAAVTLAKMANLATQRVAGRNSGGSGVPEAVTATQLLDWVAATHGNVLYRGTSAWAGLAVGTAGQVLATNGAAANPMWIDRADMLAALFNTAVSVTGATTLTGTAFGKMHVCTGTSADYTVGLPAVSGNAGKFIGFVMGSGLTRLVTLDGNASETIDGSLTRVMWAREVAVLYCDGSAWVKVGGKTIPMVARTYPSAVLGLTSSTYTTVQNNTVDFDNTSGLASPMASTGDYKVFARRAGKYRAVAQAFYAGNSSINGGFASAARVLGTVTYNGVAAGGAGEIAHTETSAASGAFPSTLAERTQTFAAGDYVANVVWVGIASVWVGNTAVYTGLSLTEIPEW